ADLFELWRKQIVTSMVVSKPDKVAQRHSVRANLRPNEMKRAIVSTTMSVVLSVALCAPSLLAAEPPAIVDIDMSVKVGRALTEAFDLMNAGRLDEAAVALQQLRNSGLNDYEMSRVLQQVVSLDIRLEMHQDAISASEALLQTQSLSEAERTSAILMLGKLYLQVEDWNKGLEHLLQANELQGNNDQETLYLIGFAYYQLQQAESATRFLEQALAVDKAQAGEPVYSLLGVLYVDAKNYPKALATYEQLVIAIPDAVQTESYYSTLSQLYAQAGNNGRAKATLQLLISTFPDSANLAEYQKRLATLN
ncbi:MAG: tetratricopeptide repeat protein, partial [Pseudomonadota bacterium]